VVQQFPVMRINHAHWLDLSVAAKTIERFEGSGELNGARVAVEERLFTRGLQHAVLADAVGGFDKYNVGVNASGAVTLNAAAVWHMALVHVDLLFSCGHQ
jgi:hypothetical protein